MGRKSVLTPEQWAEVERRHLIGGESVNSLAKEFGIAESCIRRKIKPNKAEQQKAGKPLRDLAEAKVKADREVREIAEQIAALPVARQNIVTDLARQLASVSSHLASAAEYGAATAHRLAGLAHMKSAEITDAGDPESNGALKTVAVLTKMANESSEIGLNLLRANKEMVDDINRTQPQTPVTVDDLDTLSNEELERLGGVIKRIGR